MAFIHLIHGNNNEVELPEHAAIISDPPYGCANDCDYTRFTNGIHPNRNHGEGIVGDDRPFDPSRWLEFPHVVLFGYQHFAQRLPVGTILVWLKKRDSQLGTFLSDCELAWMKGGKGCYLHQHVWHGFDRQTERGGKTLHPTQKPVALMEWIIQKAKLPDGCLIVDPFMGSGATIQAAANLGYPAIGIEVDAKHYQTACDRLDAASVAYKALEGHLAASCPFPR